LYTYLINLETDFNILLWLYIIIIGSNIYVSDETLCQSYNIREYRLRQIDNIYKSDLSSVNNKDNFMKGDNPINGSLSTVCHTMNSLYNVIHGSD